MKKIGIVTLNGYFNFGNRLQNYALTKTLENLDFDVYTIWHKNKTNVMKDFIKSKLIFMRKYNRFKHFYKFSKKNMKELLFSLNNLEKMDYYIVGSDQVWNYNYIQKDHTYFKPYKSKPTFSYSASLGTKDIPKEYWRDYQEMLKDYKSISVREENGKQILKEILNRDDIEVMLDPTLLLDKEQWTKVAKKPHNLDESEKYIFTYFLGDLKNAEKNIIQDFAKANNCKVIDILDEKSKLYSCGPEEFIYLIKNCFLVCTDSFHACVFSIIFNRPFIVFKRQGKSDYMYSRIENLLTQFRIKNREFNGLISKSNLRCDYSEAYDILNKEKEKAFKYLKNNLDIK